MSNVAIVALLLHIFLLMLLLLLYYCCCSIAVVVIVVVIADLPLFVLLLGYWRCLLLAKQCGLHAEISRGRLPGRRSSIHQHWGLTGTIRSHQAQTRSTFHRPATSFASFFARRGIVKPWWSERPEIVVGESGRESEYQHLFALCATTTRRRRGRQCWECQWQQSGSRQSVYSSSFSIRTYSILALTYT